MQPPTSSIHARRILWVAPLAGLIAAALNSILHFIGILTDLFKENVSTPTGDPLDLKAIVMMSIMSALTGGLVFFLLVRFTPMPVRLFYFLAFMVVALLFFTPFILPNITLGMIVLLELMHLMVAVVVVGFLTQLTR